MKTLYIDCAMGCAGDMLTAALLELHPDREGFIRRMNAVLNGKAVVSAVADKKCGIVGTHVSVLINGEEEGEHEHHHHHDEDDDHGHECCHHHHDHDDDDDEDEHEHHHHDGECCCGHHHHHHDHDADEVFTSWGVETAKKFSKADIEHALTELDTGNYGMILRSKGIVDGGADGWLEFDYVPGEWEVRARGADVGGKLVVIGSKLDEKAIAALFGC